MIESATRKNTAARNTMMKTMMVVTSVSLRVGQVTFASSLLTSWKKMRGFRFISANLQACYREWQEWRDSNPQPPVLETGALPVELHSFAWL